MGLHKNNGAILYVENIFIKTCHLFLITQLDRFLSWADTNRNCNIFLLRLRGVHAQKI